MSLMPSSELFRQPGLFKMPSWKKERGNSLLLYTLLLSNVFSPFLIFEAVENKENYSEVVGESIWSRKFKPLKHPVF
jgi:hypothetical protein